MGAMGFRTQIAAANSEIKIRENEEGSGIGAAVNTPPAATSPANPGFMAKMNIAS
jgi:hypothetical protein